MANWLMNLRRKPKHVRDNIALVAAGVCTLPVLGFLVFGVHGPRLTAVEETSNTDRKFFETFTSQFKEQMATVREATNPSAASSSNTAPMVIDRGPLDAVPVVPPEGATTSTRFLAATSTGATSSQPTGTR